MRTLLQISAALVALIAVPASAAPIDQDVFDSFEGFSPNTTAGVPFDIGTSPEKATFSGNAFAGVLGIGSLYNTGVRSWMVLENSEGRVDFDLNAAEVEFFARTHPSADGDTVISAFDESDSLIGSAVTLSAGAGFALVSFSGNIDHIVVDNQATNFMNAVDDFGYTAIPEPSSLLLGAVALATLLGSGRRQSSL